MVTISLQGAEFFAHHGFYPEEQVLGNKFIVDIEVSFTPERNFKDDKMSNTVDYEKLHKIAAEKMKQTCKLIETVAQSIADAIKDKYPFADTIKVSLKKQNPPLGGKVGYAGVEIII
jgi:dihydroneopterin aldolase